MTESCIYVNVLEKDTSSKLENVLKDMNKDPTLARSHTQRCPRCGHMESVCFQADVGPKSEKLQLIHVCCGVECGFKWQT